MGSSEIDLKSRVLSRDQLPESPEPLGGLLKVFDERLYMVSRVHKISEILMFKKLEKFIIKMNIYLIENL